MLVLARRERESVVLHIGEKEVQVVVLKIKGRQVKIGFTCPPEFSIARAELVSTTLSNQN